MFTKAKNLLYIFLAIFEISYSQQMTGIYVIDNRMPTGGNTFGSFQEAISYLTSHGVGDGDVDFLVTKKTNRIYLNEINTIPGFTSISMYPKLWQASGIPFPELLDRVIQLAVERHKARQHLKTVYQPKEECYKK